MPFTVSRRYFVRGMGAIAASLPFASFWQKAAIAAPEATSPGKTILEQLLQDNFLPETKALVPIPTYLGESSTNEGLKQVQSLLNQWAEDFNTSELTQLKLQPFEWKKTIFTEEEGAKEYWLFGLRIGSGTPKRTVAMICHLDTVLPGQAEGWEPFNPTIREDVCYAEGQEDFLIGRGSIDDKGPAISAFIVARALAKQFDSTNLLDDLAVEIFFDTSEETDMATPHYLEDCQKPYRNPDFGIVYDAQWAVRAEKGGERPVFGVSSTGTPQGSLWIESLESAPDSSTNQIPTYAKAVIQGEAEALNDFYAKVKTLYQTYEFDDPEYRRAELETSRDSENRVVLKTLVQGAQHGSAPNENREDGANPLVSLANFLAGLVRDNTLAVNAVGSMAVFIEWMWGTCVFGENHPALEAYDEVFTGVVKNS